MCVKERERERGLEGEIYIPSLKAGVELIVCCSENEYLSEPSFRKKVRSVEIYNVSTLFHDILEVVTELEREIEREREGEREREKGVRRCITCKYSQMEWGREEKRERE